jgi:hypothetical protein
VAEALDEYADRNALNRVEIYGASESDGVITWLEDHLAR